MVSKQSRNSISHTGVEAVILPEVNLDENTFSAKHISYSIYDLGLLMTSFGWWETFVPENEEKTNGVLRTNCLRLLISPLRYVKIIKDIFVLTMRI